MEVGLGTVERLGIMVSIGVLYDVQVGDMVSEGQALITIEAMKMQNGLHAGKTGKVRLSCYGTGRFSGKSSL